MNKFREVDLHSYLEKYNFQNKFLNLKERNVERFENKYKKFGLDRNKYTYDEFLLDKMDSIILLIEHCQPLIDKEFNLISNDTRPFSIDFKVNNLIFDLKRIFFKTNILIDESIYYEDRIKLKEVVLLLCQKYQENIKYHIKKIENIFDELEIGLRYNKELQEYLEKMRD
uniref:Uncharacterized protein n=1 Tax=Ackermannviridae sp. ctaCq7 TaxID=2827294 RepID=A0A8S5R5B4_9CAUD|nr:MAG TPA: hypothetical protein [Ackermannviridae sp. ctaCq7]